MRPHIDAGHFIDGHWVDAPANRSIDVIDPATGHRITRVPDGGADAVGAAVDAAHRARRGPWGRASPAERTSALQAMAAALRELAEDSAWLVTLDQGKPITESRCMDVPGSIRCLEYYAGWADRITGRVIPVSDVPTLSYTVREPHGVVGALVPWNGALSIGLWKVAPALAAGNTVVLKASETAPLGAGRIARLAEMAGLPPGVVNVVHGGPLTGVTLAGHPGIDLITFTGSTPVGRKVMTAAAEHLTPVVLECGGKSANIVFEDADLDAVVDATLAGIFVNQGEVCAAGSRLVVQRRVHDELVERLLTAVDALRVGDPKDAATQVGSLVSVSHRQHVHRLVEAGRDEGATIAAGGVSVSVDGCDGGAFYAPTVLTGVEPSNVAAREEIFGPVLTVTSFVDDADAVALANDSPYGLTANVHTHDLRRAHRVARGLDCGDVFVNLPPMPFVEVPFGGRKHSGFGRDLGEDAVTSMTLVKSVNVGLWDVGDHPRWF